MFEEGPKLHGKAEKFHPHRAAKPSAQLNQKVLKPTKEDNMGVSTDLGTTSCYSSTGKFIQERIQEKTLVRLQVLWRCQPCGSHTSIQAQIMAFGGCGKKCGTRCNKVKARPERCLKYCNLCCKNCKGCVPSGQYGNKDECPCYRDMKSKVGKPKCP